VIDDDDDVREIICYALEFEGIPTISFASVFTAEESLLRMESAQWPCLLIIDYFMPDMNGIDFIKILREKYPESFGQIPVALSTAHLVEECDDLPPDVIVLEKPFDLDLLLDTAKKYLKISDVNQIVD
jgi:CheY-like chemotaxis protein